MTTNVSRPIHLQLRPASTMAFASSVSTPTRSPLTTTKVLASSSSTSASCSNSSTATSDSLPSQILPHLFVGNQEQTNRDTVNRLEISYILSLGLLPLISDSTQTNHSSSAAAAPKTPTTTTIISTTAETTTNEINSTTRAAIQPHGNNGSAHDHIVLPSQNSSKDYKIRLRSSSCSNGSSSGSDQDNSTNSQQLDNENQKEAAVKAAVRYIQCKCINIADSSSEQTNLTKFFDEAHQFIDEARRKKCNILVHCLAGISRSPTIAIAYLMRVNSLRLQDAYNLVKQCRPQIDVNLSFMGQLMIYGKRLLTSCRRPIPRHTTDGNNGNLVIMSNSSSSSCDKNNVNNVVNQSVDSSAAKNLEEYSNRCTGCREHWLIAKLP